MTAAILPIPFQPATAADVRHCFEYLRRSAQELATVPLAEILNRLDCLGQLWQPGGEYNRQARSLLGDIFSSRTVAAALEGLALSLQGDRLGAELERELG